MDAPVLVKVKQVIAAKLSHAIGIADLHVWRAGSDRDACVVSLITAADVDADLMRNALHTYEQLVHVTVERWLS